MNRILVKIIAVMMIAIAVGVVFTPKTTYASEAGEVAVAAMSDEAANINSKSSAAALVIAVVAAAGALSMGAVIWKTIESIARQPEAEGKIRTAMMLGLVFVETAIIYALIVAILIIFVL